MKRKISIFLSSIMILSLFFYVNVFAASDSGFEDAVKLVKSKISIPADYTVFNFRSGTENNKKVWSMEWSTKDGDGFISVSLDDKGNILRYYNNKPMPGQTTRKLPKVSMLDAKAKAEAFIKKAAPGYFSQVKYSDAGNRTLVDISYMFNYIRVVNGIMFPNNYINISINSDTGEVQSYNATWNDNAVFPSADKVISKAEAQKAFMEKLGMGLFYNTSTDNGKQKIYPVYAPKNQNYYIDAVTGEKVELLYSMLPYFDYGFSASLTSGRAKGGMNMDADMVSLTPEETEAINSVSKVIPKEEIEKKLRAFKTLGLSDEHKLLEVSLERDYINKESIVWRMSFVKESKENPYQDSVNVSADAKTGEIKDFWINAPHKDGEEPKYDKDASKAAVEAFLKEIQPDKFKQSEFDANLDRNIYIDPLYAEKPRDFSFNYIRKVNGAMFPSNHLSAGFDAVSGRIITYNMNWSNEEFPSLDKVVSLDKIYDKLFNDVGLQLQYKENYPQEYLMKFPQPGNVKQEIRLVYALNHEKPSTFDANTGELITPDGKPYKDQKEYGYKDIKGHYAEKYIKILAEYGIAFEESEFKPDSKITQKDFMKLLSSLMNYGNGMNILSRNDSKEIEDIYKVMIREGVIKESEKAPDSQVTREDSVKFIIRMMKYDKVADIKGIYNCNYKDKNKINQDLIGYIVIADGLNIIKGSFGYFNPKNSLTRAEAFILAYNYLQN
ncbi:MAG TPA: S-layer homology domain-containing protein [Pseudobacteroides sp.]|uniref:S-layer homology domain-containing protein n=1 Tax=Pseudobacteroides sp. TaxID=1968840 RepID=UPI002F93C487